MKTSTSFKENKSNYYIKNRKLWALLFFSLLLAFSINAQTISSTTTGGNWNSTSTWVGGVIPTSTKSVIIDGPVSVNAAASMINLTINSGKVLTMSGTNTLSASGDLVVNGTINVGAATGAIAISGNSTIAGTLALGASSYTCSGTSTINSGGTISDGNNSGTNIYIGLLTVNSGGTFSSAANSPIEFRGGIVNSGTFTQVGTGAVTLTNANSLTANNSISFGGAVTVNGATSIAGTSTITFASLILPSSISVGASTTTFNITGTSSISGSLNLGAGNFTNTGTTTVTGTGSITDANDAGANVFVGLVNVNAGGSFTCAGNSTLEFRAGLTNAGTLNQAGIGNVTFTNTSTITANAAISFAGSVIVNGATTISGSNAITLGSLTNNASISVGAATASISVTGNTSVSAALNLGAGNFTTNGTTTILTGGSITDGTAAGSDIYIGLLTVNSGGTFSSASTSPLEFLGGINNAGTFSQTGTGAVTFTNTNTFSSSTSITMAGAIAVNGSTTFSVSPLLTFSGNLALNALSDIASGKSLTVSGSTTLANSVVFTNNGTASLTGALNGANAASNWINANGSILNYNNSALPFVTAGFLTASASTNTVNFTGAAQSIPGISYSTLILSGSNIKTLNAGATTIADALTINSGITLTITSGNFTQNGVLTLNGTLTDNNASGLDIFSTVVTINSGATFSSTAATAHSFEFYNGIVANGTLNLPAVALSTFKNNNQSISGTSASISIGEIDIDAGIVLTNTITTAGGLVIRGNLDGISGASEFINSANALTNYQGALAPMNTAGNFTVSAAGNTFNYSGAAQSIKTATYYHIGFTAAGVKTMADIAVNGNFNFASGTLVISGIQTFGGNTAATMFNVSVPVFTQVIVNKPGSTLTLTSNGFTTSDLSVSSGSLVFGITTARTITVSNSLSGAGDINMTNTTHNLILNGPDNVIGSLTTDANNSSVTYTRNGDQSIFNSVSYRNLVLGGSGIKSIIGGVRVLNSLTMSAAGNYYLNLGNNDFKISSAATLTGTFSATRYIITGGTGVLIKEGTTTAQLRTSMNTNGLFPVGSGGYYTPYQLNSLTGTIVGTSSISIRAVASRQPNVPYFNNALTKYWEIETANITVTSANAQFSFNASEVIGSVAGYVPRVWDGLTLSAGSGGSTPSTPGSNPFFVNNNTFLAGSWTAVDPTIRAALYSYQSGDWSSANTWTTDPSGNTLVSPMVPGAGDQVIILNGRTVTTSVSRTVGSVTINSGGVLDLGASTGHSFGPIAGEGRMRLTTTSLPSGNYLSFVSSTGGTIEYYNLGASPVTLSTTQTTYNNLEINNSTASNTVTILNSDLVVNGNFSLNKTGSANNTFTIGSAATSRTLTFNKNISLTSGSFWNIGSFNAIHTINVYGNLINSGSIDFTNAADYTAPTTGAANIYFFGINANTALTCNAGSTTTLYGFQSTKATGYELSVTAAATATLNFVSDGNTFVANNNGILRFGNNITIPRMIGNGGGNYDLGSPSSLPVLWIDGASITYNASGAIVPYGTLKITSGTLTCQAGQGGIVIRESGLILIQGGTVNARMIRTSVTAATHRGTYIQSGGTVTLSGDNGAEQGYYAVFSLPYNENVFKMSGGILNITRANTVGAFCPNGGIMIGSLAQNIDVIGGTVNINISGNNGFDISSRAPFWDLNIAKTITGTGAVRIAPITWSYSGNIANQSTLPAYPLTVLNDLNLVTSTYSGALNANGYDVICSGNYTIQNGTTYTTGLNTTMFNGTSNQVFTVSGSIGTGLNNLTVDKSGTTLTFAGTASTIASNGNLSILAGTLADGGKTLSFKGNIINSGVHSGTGKIQLNSSTSSQSISGSGTGIFQNLDISNTNGSAGSVQVNMLDPMTITGVFNMATDRLFNIANYQLTFTASGSITSSPGTFSSNRFIKTSGFLSDGGLKKTYSVASTSFTFQFGTGTSYTPAIVTFTAAPVTWGTLDLRPVTARQLYVTNIDCFNYYWKVNQTGFTGIPAGTTNLWFNYGNLADNTTYIPGYYNFQSISYTTINNVNAVDETFNVIYFNNFNFLEGDYTAGIPAAFGTVVPYYSRTSGNWNTASTWSNSGFGGTASATIPTASVPVFIGDGNTYNHTVAVTSNATVSGSLLIGAGSTLDLGTTTGNNFGALPYSTAGGSGKIKISSASSTAEFPAGDFGLFFQNNGGTTEYYTTAGNYTIPTVTASPTSMNIQSYKNLIVAPTSSYQITLPNSDLDIYQNITVNGANTTSDVAVNDASSKTMNILGDLIVNGGRFRFKNSFAQTINLTGNLTIASGALVDVSSSGSIVHSLNIYGNLTNNGTLDLNNASDVSLSLLGTLPANILGTNVSAVTDLYNLIINKGNSQTIVVDASLLGTLTATNDNWLSITNGTFRFSKGSTITLTSGSDVSYTIPSNGKLSVNNAAAIVNVGQNNTGGSDLIIAGGLEIIDGTVNVGASAYSSHNDIEYSPTDFPSISVKNNGVLNVNGQIRRSVYALQGALTYSQSDNSTVLVRGKNPDASGSFNLDRAKFEILNDGSSFSMSGNSLLIIDKTGLASNMFGDIYLNPASYSITGGEVRIGTGNTGAAMNFDMTSTSPFWNFTVDGTTTSKTLNNLTNPTTFLNNLTIDGNSIFKANGLDITVNGNIINRNSNASTGISVGGYQAGTNAQTTYLTGSTSNQSITGVTGNILNFANLVISNTYPTGGINLTASVSNVRVNGSLTMNSGSLNILDNTFTSVGNILTNVNSTTTTGNFVLGGTSAQIISGNGNASFQNVNMLNAAGVELTAPLTINGNLNFTTGLFYINNYLLTLGVNASISGTLNTSNMIRVNGVISDAGVKKLYPASASNFTFPIGTTLKYTPATINLTSNSIAGTITVLPISVKHPATTDPLNLELTYYWSVNSTGLSPSVTATHIYNYHPNDAINGDETQYRAGRYFNNQWTPINGIAGAVNAATDKITLTAVNYIKGDFTAGESTEFGAIQTYFSRNATLGGNWSDLNSWSTDATLQHAGPPCTTAPSSNNFVIAAGHTINCQVSDINLQSPVAVINGTLNLNSTSGHNFGVVSGTGTVRLTPNGVNQFIFPGGDFSVFTSNTGGEIEYSSTVSSLLPLQSTYNHIKFSGAGTKSLANVNLLINGDVTINAGSVSNASNRNLTLLGNWTNSVGLSGYVPGTGMFMLSGANQNITGSTNFYHLNTSTAGIKTLYSSIYVNNKLTLGQGIFSTGNNELVMTVSSTVIGGSTSSYVNGNLRKYLPAGTLTSLFEIGDNNYYTPAEITFQGSILGSGNILARTDAGDHANIYLSGINDLKSCNRTWTLTPTSLSGYTGISMKLNFNTADLDVSANLLSFTGGYYTGSTWMIASSATPQLNYTQLTGLTGLGVFQLGEAINGIIWTGATSTAWNNANNWLPNTIPGSNDNIVIGLVSNQPNLTTGADGLGKNLTLYSGTTVTIGSGKTVNINGAITSTNASILGSGTLNINSTSGALDGNLIVSSHLAVASGAIFSMHSGADLELGRDFTVQGQFFPGSESVTFFGSQSSSINSLARVIFNNLIINKADPTLALILNENIQVNGTLSMLSGDIDLTTKILDLSSSGNVIGETNSNRIFGTTGTITLQRAINAPNALNVGGLGAEITSTENFGTTTIIRGNQQQVYNAGFGMNRYYEIHPTNNSNLDATLKFNYYDDELNTQLGSILETEIDLWRFDGAYWNVQFATLDALNNQLVKTNIPQFSTWTGGSKTNNALPISLVSFDGICNGSMINLNWSTASELNNKLFFLEESPDAKQWLTVKTVQGAGNSTTNKNYSETVSSNYSEGSYYRLTQVDFNGNSRTFDPIFVNCEKSLSNEVSIMPNPAVDIANVTIQASEAMEVNMNLFSSSGQILFSQKVRMSKGSNVVKLDVSALPPGAYHLNISNDKKIELTGSRSIIKR